MKKSLTLTLFSLLLFVTVALGQTEATSSAAFRPAKSQITEAQQTLKNSGAYSGPVDGRYNDAFRDSLREYQKANGLEASGKLDRETLEKMSIGLTDSQKGIAKASSGGRKVFRATKDQISEGQRILKSRGMFSGDETGKYSKEFRDAVRQFQSESGIRRTGTLNRATIEKLGIALSESQAAIPVNPKDLEAQAPRGSRGPVFRANRSQIAEVQTMLKQKGLYSGEATGKLDDATRAAIKQWQAANSVKETGTLNKETLSAMGVKLTDNQLNM